MSETILVIDVGLTNCKVVVLSPDGEIIDRESVAYKTYFPQPGWIEQDPEEWWLAILAALARLRVRVPEALKAIDVISVTGHMHALVCLGPDGATLGRSLVLGDQRSLAEADAISSQVGLEQVYKLTGARIDVSMPLAKLCWLRAHEPAIHRQARAFLSCKDWIRHRLTGDLFTDPIDACGTSLYDIQRRTWSPELIAAAGIRPEQLPEVLAPCAVAGRLASPPAEALGLQAGIPVVVGAGDDVEVLGNGLLAPGLSLEHMGTTGSILTCAEAPVYDPLMALELYPHVDPDLWVLGGSVTAAGLALDWAERVLSEEAPTSVSSTEDTWHPDLERPLIFLPHLAGERCPSWEPQARGSWVGLTSAHSASDLRQAVLEGIAFSLKSVLGRIESLVGPQRQITVSARETSDHRWMALRASIYGRPLVLLETSEPTALGAMIVAAVGVGIYQSLSEAAQCVTGSQRIIEPETDLAVDYARLYRLYRRTTEMMLPLMQRWVVDP